MATLGHGRRCPISVDRSSPMADQGARHLRLFCWSSRAVGSMSSWPKTLAITVDRLLRLALVCQLRGDSARLTQALGGQGMSPRPDCQAAGGHREQIPWPLLASVGGRQWANIASAYRQRQRPLDSSAPPGRLQPGASARNEVLPAVVRSVRDEGGPPPSVWVSRITRPAVTPSHHSW